MLEFGLFFGPGGWSQSVGLLVGHLRQAREDIAQVIEGIDLQAPAVLDDREKDRAALPGIGLSDEQPVLLFMESSP